MITLADQVAQGVSDAGLTSDVRAFNALSLAKEQVSQQRALLNYSFSNPNQRRCQNVAVDPNTELALQIALSEELSDEAAFQQAATPAERAFLASTLTLQRGGQERGGGGEHRDQRHRQRGHGRQPVRKPAGS